MLLLDPLFASTRLVSELDAGTWTQVDSKLKLDYTVALSVEHRSSDRDVTGSTPAQALLHNNLRQVVYTPAPLSSSSITWYRCKNWEGNGRLYKRCGISSITLSVSSLLA